MSARGLTILLSVTLAVVGVMTDGHGMGVQPRPLIGADQHPRPLIDTYPRYEMGTEELDEEGVGEINYMPLMIEEGLYNMKRVIGRPATITCTITGMAPLNIFIIQDHVATFRNKNLKRAALDTIHDPNNPNILTAVYTIKVVEKRDSGIYRCQGEAGTGEIVTSLAELFAVDPCEGVECGYKEQCINVQGASKCTCDYSCKEGVARVCADGVTYGSMCHFDRQQCRTGATVEVMPEEGECVDHQDATEATCTFMGNGHVERFDANYFSFSGSCSYKMIEDDRDGMFIVYARTEICGTASEGVCLRSVTIYVDRKYGLSLERGWLINDNGRSRNIKNGETLVLGGGLVTIKRVGKTMVGTIAHKGIVFYYDGLNYLRVSVPLSFISKATDFTGFCGRIPVDYIPMRSMGRDVGISGEVGQMKGLSMKCENTITTLFDTCDSAEAIGASFDSPSLAACKSVISLEAYIRAAVRDTCSCDHGIEINYCYCNIMYAYVEDCRQAGVTVEMDYEQCEKNFHQQAFKAESISYRRVGRWFSRQL